MKSIYTTAFALLLMIGMVHASTLVVSVDVTGAEEISGAQIDLNYNSTNLHYLHSEEGTFLSENGLVRTASAEPEDNNGVLDDYFVIRLSEDGLNGSGIIAKFYFDVTGTNDYGISLGDVLLANVDAQPINATVTYTLNEVNTPPPPPQPTACETQLAEMNTTCQVTAQEKAEIQATLQAVNADLLVTQSNLTNVTQQLTTAQVSLASSQETNTQLQAYNSDLKAENHVLRVWLNNLMQILKRLLE